MDWDVYVLMAKDNVAIIPSRMHAVYTTESTLGRRETNTLDTSGFILVRF